MDQKIISHINVSVSKQIDVETLVGCIKGTIHDEVWSYHVKTFFLETSIRTMHDIVLAGFVTFAELYRASLRWDPEGYADGKTKEWVKEMYYLSVGRAAELGSDRFI